MATASRSLVALAIRSVYQLSMMDVKYTFECRRLSKSDKRSTGSGKSLRVSLSRAGSLSHMRRTQLCGNRAAKDPCAACLQHRCRVFEKTRRNWPRAAAPRAAPIPNATKNGGSAENGKNGQKRFKSAAERVCLLFRAKFGRARRVVSRYLKLPATTLTLRGAAIQTPTAQTALKAMPRAKAIV